jgi:hypothetical protein
LQQISGGTAGGHGPKKKVDEDAVIYFNLPK